MYRIMANGNQWTKQKKRDKERKVMVEKKRSDQCRKGNTSKHYQFKLKTISFNVPQYFTGMNH